MSEKNVTKAAEMESIMIPRRGSNEDINLYVSINGRSWLIPRGKRVELPKYVCDHIRAAWAAEEKADQHSEELIQQGNQGMNA